MRVLFVNHWFFTLVSMIYIAGFIVIAFDLLPDDVLPKSRSSLPSPWLMGAGAVMFVLAAIASWMLELRPSGLTDEHLERVRKQRLAEIQSWLVRSLSVDDVHEMIAADYHGFGCPGKAPEMIAVFDDWFTQNASIHGELWYYDTGEDSWENLAGENGFALVRHGRVVEFMMWSMN